MKRFNYKAKDRAGRVVKGEVEAVDIDGAAKLVRGKGFFVISLNPKIESPFSFIRKMKDKINEGDVANFTRQLSTMINAGLPITEALLKVQVCTNPFSIKRRNRKGIKHIVFVSI